VGAYLESEEKADLWMRHRWNPLSPVTSLTRSPFRDPRAYFLPLEAVAPRLLPSCRRYGSRESFGATFCFWSRRDGEVGVALSEPMVPQPG
jgi:hypothetical protein